MKNKEPGVSSLTCPFLHKSLFAAAAASTEEESVPDPSSIARHHAEAKHRSRLRIFLFLNQKYWQNS